MKKRELILVSIIILLVIAIIGIIIFYNKKDNEQIVMSFEATVIAVGDGYILVETKTDEYEVNVQDADYQIGDVIKLHSVEFDKKTEPIKATPGNITIIKRNHQANSSKQEDASDNGPSNLNPIIKENNNEEEVIKYYNNYEAELTNYNNDSTISETIKSKFVRCIDFIFYEGEINGTTFKELTDTGKLKVLELILSIDSKIEAKFPGYKESIGSSYQNIKSKVVEKYLEITSNICNRDQELCNTAKLSFNDLKENFGITWDLIKELASKGTTKLSEWYEIWKYK